MLSKKGNNLLDVNFKMYFFMKTENDLYYVLDCDYKIVDELIVKD